MQNTCSTSDTIPAPLQALYDAAAAIGPEFDLSPENVFDDCGLILEIPPARNWMDWCTPRNVLTFATTGGDSVHYSYLVDERLPADVCPIVMTLPCVNEFSWVVAESFQEFFDYGYHVGWFSLEQLYYDEEEGEAYFRQPSDTFSELGAEQLALLHKVLNMKPVPPALTRIAELQEKYHAMLAIPPMPED
ncbi:MAG: hypothetical protein RSD82_10065 [Comamonas sp.]